jgi:calpain-7
VHNRFIIYFFGSQVIGGAKGGRRVDSVMQGEEIFSSEAYRAGFCFAATEALDVGTYTVIVSTYNANSLGAFRLNIHAPAPLQLARPIPPEGDTMQRQVRPWTRSWP